MLIPVIFGELGYAISALLYPVPRSRMGSTLILSNPTLPLEVWRSGICWLTLEDRGLAKLEPQLQMELRTEPNKRLECLEGSRVMKIEHRKQKEGSQHEYILAYVDVKYEGERLFRLQRMGKASLASGNAIDVASQSSKKFSNKLVRRTEEDGAAAVDQIVLDEKPGLFKTKDAILCSLRFNDPAHQPTFVDLCAVCCAVASVYSDYHLVKSQCYLFAVSVYLVLGAKFSTAPSERAKDLKTRGIWHLVPTASRSWTKYEKWTAVNSDLEGVPLPGEEGIPIPPSDEAQAKAVLPDVRNAHQNNSELQPFDREAALTPKGRAKLARLCQAYATEAQSLRAAMAAAARSQPVFDRSSAMAPLSALRVDHATSLHDEYSPPPSNTRTTYPRVADASRQPSTLGGQPPLGEWPRPAQRSSTWSQQTT